MKNILKKIWRWTYRTLLVFLVICIMLGIWFYFAVRIEKPVPASTEVLKLERKKVAEDFYTINHNWLKKSETGLWEMYIEGDGFERGVIEGKLNKELAEQQEIAFVDQIKKMIPSQWMLSYLKYFVAFFNRNLDEYVTNEYQLEIYGESLYASDKFDFMAPKYHRMLNYHAAHDIGHAIQDKNMAVGCTAFGAWDSRTSDSAILIGRNFDFYVGDAFAENKIVNFVKPKNGYKLMMVTWAGMIGTVSGMNEKGLTVTINASKSEIPTSAATPISLVAREILQYAKNIHEAFEIAKKRKVFVSESLMIGSKEDGRTATIEKTPSKTELFETEYHDYIICANHYQSKSFSADAINMENKAGSSSQYRLDRMNQLLSKHQELTVKDAAGILRDRKGMNDKEIGMGNEKAMNQLIAHHAVIFQPESLLMWVSAGPYQLGQFVCYDFDKIFAEAPGLNEKKEIYEKALSIPADSFLLTKEYGNYKVFRAYKETIKEAARHRKKGDISDAQIREFVDSNPEYYDTYWIVAEYYRSRDKKQEALKYYRMALAKEIATVPERESIQQQINELTQTDK